MTKRNVWLILVSLFIGPAVGALTFLVFVTLTDSASGASSAHSERFVSDYWPLVLMFAYVVGFIPAALSATIMIVVTRYLPTIWHRLAAGTAIGAVVCAISIGIFIFTDDTSSVDDIIILGGAALTGAISALACVALIELFHPLPVPPKAPA